MTMAARGKWWRWTSYLVLATALVVACASDDDTAPAPTPQRGEVEVARQTVGPGGGTVSGGGATLEVPEGAVPADTEIVIKTIDAAAVTLPATATLAGTVYSFAPDDVTFSKPITITVAVREKTADGKGATVLLRSPTSQNQWVVKGATVSTVDTVTATTDHFSDWAPVTEPEAACFLDAACGGDAASFECSVPQSGAGVRCSGLVATGGTCTCQGDSAVIATPPTAPTPSFLSALAVACGAICPGGGTSTPDGGQGDEDDLDASPDAGGDASDGGASEGDASEGDASGGDASGGDASGGDASGGDPDPVPPCGDGKVSAVEQCDDGNARSGDGCSSSCEIEPGYTCSVPGQPCQK